MRAKVVKKPIFAVMLRTITLPSCKSVVIRQIMAQYVLHGTIMEIAEDACNDIRITRRALKCIAAPAPKETRIDIEDCGAAFRFMMALLAVTPGQWLLTGTPRLLLRPILELAETLTSIGASLHYKDDGWHIEGREIRAEELTIDCCRTSQFASALVLIAPRIGLKRLHVSPVPPPSQSYVQLTRQCMHATVKMPELPDVSMDVGRVGDWSSALFWYAKATLSLNDSFLLRGLSMHSAQGDAIVSRWFVEMNVISVENEEGVLMRADGKFIPVRTYEYDVYDHPDVVPIMAVLACLHGADFYFFNTRILAFKESDRARCLAEQLRPFARVIWKENSLRVMGKPRNRWPKAPYLFHSYNDHRMAMAFLLFGEEAIIDDLSCLQKSYPQLMKDLLKPHRKNSLSVDKGNSNVGLGS